MELKNETNLDSKNVYKHTWLKGSTQKIKLSCSGNNQPDNAIK